MNEDNEIEHEEDYDIYLNECDLQNDLDWIELKDRAELLGEEYE